MNLIEEVRNAVKEAQSEGLMGYPTFLYLGIYQHSLLVSFARRNLEMFEARNAETWRKQMFMGMEVIPVDKYSWLKVGP